MPNRIKELRRAAGMTQQELADRIDADLSTAWRYEHGVADLFKDKAKEIARVLGLKSPEQLIYGPPPQVELLGDIGAGAQVFPLDSANEWLDPPPGLAEGFALRVVGRSMMPVYRPNDILFVERRSHVSPDVIGQDCCVQVKDGPRLVKRVHSGHAKGFFRLYSYDTQDESDDVALDWAAPVRWISR